MIDAINDNDTPDWLLRIKWSDGRDPTPHHNAGERENTTIVDENTLVTAKAEPFLLW